MSIETTSAPMRDRNRRPARLMPDRSALMVVDLQYRLVQVMHDRKKLRRRASRLVQGSSILGIPQLVTEQYPRGLGDTIEDVARHLDPVCSHEKTRFSAYIRPIREKLEELGVDSVVVAGVEAHVCVLRTSLDLIEAGYRVFAVWDAIGSRRAEDQLAARERLTQAGAVPTTVEAVLFEWLGDAEDGRSRKITELISGDAAD